MYRGIFVTLLVLLGVGHPGSAQWISFDNETASRLRIRPYVDGSGDRITDDQEKDFAVGDLNKDGWDDVVVVRKRPFSNPGARQDILLMNRQGVLTDATSLWAPEFLTQLTDARDVVIADFDGDTWLDVVIANTFEQQPVFYRNLGESGGNWQGLAEQSNRFPTIQVPGDVNTVQICAVAAGDVTGNGSLDLYFSNYKDFGGTHDILFINDGTGNFTNETERLGVFANVAFGTSSEIHDMDNDGDNDIVKINALYKTFPFDHGVYVLFNDGNGVFDTVPFQEVQGDDPYMFTVFDPNGDGKKDVYVVKDSPDRVAIGRDLVPNGPIDFQRFTITANRVAGFGGNVKVVDVDNDGDIDVGLAPIDVDIANCGFSSEFTLFENTGSGLRDNWAGNNQNIHIDPHDFAFLDVNRDGCQDIFMGLCEGWRVFIQNCP